MASLESALQQQKSQLEKELESFAKEDKNNKNNWEVKYPNREDGDKDEEADEVQEYENLLSLEQSLEVKLKDVNDALEKIRKGTYGICEKCGKAIEEERLKVYPAARLCITCNGQS